MMLRCSNSSRSVFSSSSIRSRKSSVIRCCTTFSSSRHAVVRRRNLERYSFSCFGSNRSYTQVYNISSRRRLLQTMKKFPQKPHSSICIRIRSEGAKCSESTTTRNVSSIVRIGNVEKRILPESHYTDEQRSKIPNGYLNRLGINTTADSSESSSSVQHLQWLLQKDLLNQDACLVSYCGVSCRRLALAYGELTNKPVEIVTISQDTTESDLKQRRRLVTTTTTNSTNIVFDDAAPVRAATHGHLLILDGLQYAERNVLPTINNLLENREIQLEDGRFLVDSKRYNQLMRNGMLQTDNSFLTPVHDDFRVIALLKPSSTLDPPVRSRFQMRRVDASIPTTNTTKDLQIFGTAITMQSSLQSPFEYPITTVLPTVASMLKLFPHESPRNILARGGYPYVDLVQNTGSRRKNKKRATTTNWVRGMMSAQQYNRCCEELQFPPNTTTTTTNTTTSVLYTLDRIVPPQTTAENINEDQGRQCTVHMKYKHGDYPVAVPVPCGSRQFTKYVWDRSDDEDDFVKTEHSEQVLSGMIQEHAVRRDILLVSEKGAGKSKITQQFAKLLGYETYIFGLYKEMTAHDLVFSSSQQRSSSGDGKHDCILESPLLQAARTGQICVLDGVDKISGSTLATLQGLLTDREVHLPDGTVLSTRDGSIHPSFRVIALGSIGGSGSTKIPPPSWISEEATSMFSTIVLPKPSRDCLRSILLPHCTYSKDELDQLLAFHETLQNTVAEDCGVSPLSVRTMIRLVRRGGSGASSLYSSINEALLADLVSTTQRASIESVLRSVGIESDSATHSGKKSTLTSSLTAVTCTDKELTIGGFTMQRNVATKVELVPAPYFFDIPSHVAMIQNLLSEWSSDSTRERAFLLLGNQGTGKNKICDRICQLANFEREYIQLHRDSTIGQLTLSPSLEDGKIVWKDSPLVRAVRDGRSLVIDEADKAPLEVVAILKSLIEDGELLLADGRKILRDIPPGDNENIIPMHPDFTCWVLANRPGKLFHGNDFFAEVGDCFSSHVIPNPDLESEIQLLQSYAPNVKKSLLHRVASAFDELRSLFQSGDITYPYSTREAVGVAKHLEAFSGDGENVEMALHNVLDLDSFDEEKYLALSRIFRKYKFDFRSYGTYQNVAANNKHNSGLQIEYVDDRTAEGSSSSPPKLSTPKVGKWDEKNEAHVGGNQWQGGTGGSDTAGLGGRGGPYRLDRGHKVHQVSEEAKEEVSKEAKAAARRMATKALKEKLHEINMDREEYEEYTSFLSPIKSDVANLRAALASVQYKTSERDWVKRQLSGELDDARLVEGVAGEKHIYKRRGTTHDAHNNNSTVRRKRLRFVVDISGSMYRFESYDGRLRRCMQAAALVMEALEGLDDKFDYSIVGHSGDSRCIPLVDFGSPPTNQKERYKILQTMVAHTQYCDSGDNTLGAIQQAISDVSSGDSNAVTTDHVDSVVIAISDANLERYGISPYDLGRIMKQEDGSNCKTFCIFIASFGSEAEEIKKSLPLGRGFVCDEPGQLPGTVRNILTEQII